MVSISRYALLPLALLAACPAYASVEISSKPTANMECAKGSCKPTGKPAILNVNDLEGMLATGSVAIKSNRDDPDIMVDAALSWTSTNRLALDSFHSVTVSDPILVSGRGVVTIKTSSGGDYRFAKTGRIAFSDLHSKLNINGIPYTLAATLGQTANLAHTKTHIALSDNIDNQGASRKVIEQGPEVFDGMGNAIANLTIFSTADEVGLFGATNGVRDLNVINAKIVASGGRAHAGIIAGDLRAATSFIKYCYVTGQISASGSQSYVGGLVGGNPGSISFSRSDATVSAISDDAEAGGLVGISAAGDQQTARGSVNESYATGAVTGGDEASVGGLIGHNNGGSISNSYATGPVTGGANSYAGGLVGSETHSDDTGPTITSSYSTGLVSGGADSFVGGFIGDDTAQNGATNDYWDLDSSGIGDPSRGAGNIQNDPGITGLSDTELKFSVPSGFDKAVWKQKSNINNGYPYLIDNPPPK